MDFFDILLSKTLSGGGGGGGSSDFSTAEVTLVNNVYGVFLSNFPILILHDEVAPDFYEWDNQVIDSATYSVMLYKGVTYAFLFDGQGNTQDVSVTGSIEYDSDKNMFAIRGNGTITLS